MYPGRWLFPQTAAWAILTSMTDAPKPRWFHFTPDRLILWLLAVEGLLKWTRLSRPRNAIS
jgi:hypothetical protein